MDWSTREQLCLVSAVSKSGENWQSVSRSLKNVCFGGRELDEEFSQKSCALQYDELLQSSECEETTKRTKSTSDVPEASGGLIRRLTAQRIQELKETIQQEQKEYVKIYAEVKAIQTGQLSEEQLQVMWVELEQEHETQRIEEMKLENRMREREQRKQEMQQRDWRTLTTSAFERVTGTANEDEMDMRSGVIDVKQIIDSGNPMLTKVGETVGSQTPQQQHPQPPLSGSTAPLLSSLLKSPTTTSNTVFTAVSSAGINSARTSAPTITTLLTSGSIPNTNQPMITLKSTIPPNEAVQLLTRPISGPPVPDALAAAANAAQNLLSPSQSAPTLSMLLEKNKSQSSLSSSDVTNINSCGRRSIEPNTASSAVKTTDESNSNVGLQRLQVQASAFDSNNEEVPMDIEEDISAAATAAAIASNSGDFDEPDDSTEEENQLMEVFKNIGNIDELDIDVAAVIDDEEVDFLNGVDEDPSPLNDDDYVASEIVHFGIEELEDSTAKNYSKMRGGGEKELLKTERETKIDTKVKQEMGQVIERRDNVKIDSIISSDDSNDNIPLAAVASLENKERDSLQEKIILKEKVESANKNNDAKQITASIENKNWANDAGYVEATSAAATSIDDSRKDFCNSTVHPIVTADVVKNVNLEQSPRESECSDVIVIPTDEESNGAKQDVKSQVEDAASEEDQQEKRKLNTKFKSNHDEDTIVKSKFSSIDYDTTVAQTNANEYETIALLSQTTISIVDTDDSSTTDVSITTRKDERVMSSSKHNIAQQHRKSIQDVTSRSESSKVYKDSAVTATAVYTKLAKPTVLRKLRDRDRSESPMIDDEITTTSDHSANQRSRRRYSSTPVIDSIPNSPTSSERDRDDLRESRVSKKSLISICNALQPNKNTANVFQRAFSDSEHYDEICQRPMDFVTIKKNIDSGLIRNVNELQRDVMLMYQNAIMVCKTSSATYKAALNLMQECQTIREFTANIHCKESFTSRTVTEKEIIDNKPQNNSSGSRVRGSSRKSQRIT